jgi:hypothetical protein
MSFVFSKLSRWFLCLSVIVQYGQDRRLVDGDACNPLVDESCAPADMTFSAMKSMRISSMDFSTALKSPDIHARDQISQVSEQTLNVKERVVMSQ